MVNFSAAVKSLFWSMETVTFFNSFDIYIATHLKQAWLKI